VTARTRQCDAAVTSGRLRKAEQFLEAAETIREFADHEHDVADAHVTLCVHAAIAAADVICCVELGMHAVGENHVEALTLLSKVRPDGPELAKSLRVLLSMKTRVGYGAEPASAEDRKRAQRQTERLARAARDRATGAERTSR
jgi:hypothetical protein